MAWFIALVLVPAILLLVLVWWTRKRRRRKQEAEVDVELPEFPETDGRAPSAARARSRMDDETAGSDNDSAGGDGGGGDGGGGSDGGSGGD